jgi:HEPN domain-containing protein
MQFRAEEYYRGALERMTQARTTYRDESGYALAMYCAGLAVECLLRAFRWSENAAFEGRHDLSALLKASRMLRVDEDHLRRRGVSEDDISKSGRRLNGALNDVFSLWHNDLRCN